MPPSRNNGKICYVEMPAADVMESARFYEAVFGWRIRTRPNGEVAFDDATGQVSGTWIVGLPPSTVPGILISIMVDDAEETLRQIAAAGCQVVQGIGAHAPEITARFLDPGGNLMSVYQEPVSS